MLRPDLLKHGHKLGVTRVVEDGTKYVQLARCDYDRDHDVIDVVGVVHFRREHLGHVIELLTDEVLVESAPARDERKFMRPPPSPVVLGFAEDPKFERRKNTVPFAVSRDGETLAVAIMRQKLFVATAHIKGVCDALAEARADLAQAPTIEIGGCVYVHLSAEHRSFYVLRGQFGDVHDAFLKALRFAQTDAYGREMIAQKRGAK